MNERRAKIHMAHPLPKARRCQLLKVPRSTVYYQPTPVSTHDLALMRLIDELEDRSETVNRKPVQRLMRLSNTLDTAFCIDAHGGGRGGAIPPALLIYRHAYETPLALRDGLARYFEFYNARRRHSALDRRTPDAVYFEQARSEERRVGKEC